MPRPLTLLTLTVALLIPGSARADVEIAKGPPALGYVHLVASATSDAGDLRIVEEVDGAGRDVASTASPLGGIDAKAPWTCERHRVFVAIARDERSAPLAVTTPSCAKRLKVASAATVGLSGNLQVRIFDRWQRGGVAADLCVTRPNASRTCRHVVMPPGEYITHGVYRASLPGAWRITVKNPTQSVSRSVIVVREHYPRGEPTVLATGDSMMLATTHSLAHRLSGRARTVRDIYVGSSI
jgi:hypothetical protein